MSVVSVPMATAGSNGQQLSLHDDAGILNSAYVEGYNQHCDRVRYEIPNWPGRNFNIKGWWWRDSASCGHPEVVNELIVVGFRQANFQQEETLDFLHEGPPVSQSASDWWSCEVDRPGWNAIVCRPGYESFG
jgi:hypothetical protein